jgi:hypothetical protein
MPKPLTEEAVVTTITQALSDRVRIVRAASGALADAIEAIPDEGPLGVLVESVDRSSSFDCMQNRDVVATIGDLRITALVQIHGPDEISIFMARLSDEPGQPTMDGYMSDHAENFQDLGMALQEGIIRNASFQYGAGVVRLGDGPLRHINAFNCVFEVETSRLHLNDIVIDLVNDVIEPIDADDQRRAPKRYLVNGVPLEFAIDANYPDAEYDIGITTIDSLMERLGSGASTGVSITIDGIERTIGADDIVIVRQPRLEEVLDLDRNTLSDPVRRMLDACDSEIAHGADPVWIRNWTDQNAGAALHADFGGVLAFDERGSEGMFRLYEGEAYDSDGMDILGRMVRIREISAQNVALAA